MALKYNQNIIDMKNLGSSNCTFMELKSGSADGFLFGIARSNCTFMELKSKISKHKVEKEKF